jgi:hypothetical protein
MDYEWLIALHEELQEIFAAYDSRIIMPSATTTFLCHGIAVNAWDTSLKWTPA